MQILPHNASSKRTVSIPSRTEGSIYLQLTGFETYIHACSIPTRKALCHQATQEIQLEKKSKRGCLMITSLEPSGCSTSQKMFKAVERINIRANLGSWHQFHQPPLIGILLVSLIIAPLPIEDFLARQCSSRTWISYSWPSEPNPFQDHPVHKVHLLGCFL